MLVAVFATGCYGGTGGRGGATGGSTGDVGTSMNGSGDTGDAEPSDVVPSGPTGLRLLTPTQYRNSVVDVLGDVAADAVGQWRSSIAAAQGGVSPAGVEEYEAAAFAVTEQVFADPTRRMAVTGCTPQLVEGDPCTASVIETLGRRAWRRPLTSDEIARWEGVALSTADLLDGDAWVGLQHAVAGLLQSPHFLYRVELGEPEGDRVRLDAWEVASRLSYLVWNTTPDDALLDAAARGDLDDAEGLSVEVERLLESPRAREGTVQVFVDMLDLDALHSLQKDGTLLPAFTPTIGPAMREEMVRVIEDTVIERRDVRRLFDTRKGFVDAELAALYGLPGTFGSDFTEVELPDTRGGLLTLAGFLAINSGEASTSPTKRGLTVRRVLMCTTIPPPPPDVEAELPEPGGGEHQTKRDQLEAHRTNPACAGCHELTDPIGLALEHFDALGGYRETDQGLTIDPSGKLDGVAFDDAVGLGSALIDHPSMSDCTIRNLYRYAVGHVEQSDEEETIDALVAALEDSGFDMRATIEAFATSESFRVGIALEDAP